MMDQLVSPMNSGVAVEPRDNGKSRSDAAPADKSGFGDTLSSVKAKDQHAHKDEPAADLHDDGDAAKNDASDKSEQDAILQRQRRAELHAKAALALNGQGFKRGKEPVTAEAAADMLPPRGSNRLKGEDAATLLKAAMAGDLRNKTKGEDENEMPMVDVTLEGDAAIADMVTNFLGTAEAASAVISQSAKGDLEGDERLSDRPRAKSVDSIFGLKKDEAAVPGINGDSDVAGTSEANYRFNSVKGDGLRSLDMSVRSQDGKIDFEVKDLGGRITENVSVLESRRFLGLATPTNATALAGLIANDSEWMSALRPENALLNAATQSSTGKVVHSLKLLLTPQDLGSVTVSLRMVGEELKVHMSVENHNAHRRLQEDNRAMMEALKAHGITVDQITISVSAAEKSDQTQSQNQGQNANNAQINNDSENGRDANARNRQAQGEQSGGRDGGQQSADIDRDADQRTGGVYL